MASHLGSLSETRWTQSGKNKLASGVTLMHSGHEGKKAPHTMGVAMMISQEAYWMGSTRTTINESIFLDNEGID